MKHLIAALLVLAPGVAASDEAPRVEEVVEVLRGHAAIMSALAAKIRELPDDPNVREAHGRRLNAALEPLAKREAELFEKLDPESRLEVFRKLQQGEAADLFGATHDDGSLVELFRSVGIPGPDEAPSRKELLEFNAAPPEKRSCEPGLLEQLAKALDPVGTAHAQSIRCKKRAMCIGWIIGHRKCCGAHKPGNGVCAGGPVDCYGHKVIWSKSCPDCNWCQC